MSAVAYLLICLGMLIWIVVGGLAGFYAGRLHHRQTFEPEVTPYSDPPTIQLRKIHIPTFGTPEVLKYDQDKFVIPLVCAAPHCRKPLRHGEDYFEIPIPDGEPGSAVGVHIGCVMDTLAGAQKS